MTNRLLKRSCCAALVCLVAAAPMASPAAGLDSVKYKAAVVAWKLNRNKTYHPSVPKPTLEGVRYGDHPRHTLDFWQAESDTPTPLVYVIHGGGWKGGSSKAKIHTFVDVDRLLKAGVSVASINYRLMKHAKEVVPPVRAPMEDAARGLQFVRSRAAEWNFDPSKVGLTGGSAGACTSLWLAYHDDLAEPSSADPVARQSTRPTVVAVRYPQTTLDPKLLREWIPNAYYGGHAFGIESKEAYFAAREQVLPWALEYSPYSQASADDPPTYMIYPRPPTAGAMKKDPTHSAVYGVKLQERCRELGVPCELVYPGAPDVTHPTITDYLIAKLVGAAR